MIIGRKINSQFNLGANHSYFFRLGNWYHHLKRFPGILTDTHGYIRIENEEEYLNSSYLIRGQRLHTKNGINSLPNYIRFNEEQLFILNQILNKKIGFWLICRVRNAHLQLLSKKIGQLRII